jgi:hypothetical protein
MQDNEQLIDLITEALDDSMGPDWNTRLGARYVAEALSHSPPPVDSKGVVERLRKATLETMPDNGSFRDEPELREVPPSALQLEAADLIDRLTASEERLRGALVAASKGFVSIRDDRNSESKSTRAEVELKRARQALGEDNAS